MVEILQQAKFVLRFWRIFALSTLALLGASLSAVATPVESGPAIGSQREFWVWDLRVMPPGFRRTSATLRAAGERSLVYVEDLFWNTQIQPEYMERLSHLLEKESPAGSLVPERGVVPAQENVFGHLPTRVGQDDRLIVLFADLGKYKDHEFDGFFNAYDQQTEAEAQKEDQHSNEANIIYLNGLRGSEAYTNGVIAHELQHLLVHDPSGATQKDSWLSETLAEGAMLFTGHFSDQGHVDRFLKNTGAHPLVSPTYVSYGPQLLFSSFLIDSTTPGPGNLRDLARTPLPGRDAVEYFFESRLDLPQSFDAIFSNFISYIFSLQSYQLSLPLSWPRAQGLGISLNEITPYKTVTSPNTIIDGYVMPYAFVLIELANEIKDSTIIRVEPIRPTTAEDKKEAGAGNCARTASSLWKPIDHKRIVVYGVGCEPRSKQDLLHFRLIIADQASPKGLEPN